MTGGCSEGLDAFRRSKYFKTYVVMRNIHKIHTVHTYTRHLHMHPAVLYLRELYDQPKVALTQTTRTVKAEAIEALP